MIFEGIIESVSSVTEGISKSNTPFRSCTITMAEEKFFPQRIWAVAMNQNCDLVQKLVSANTMSDGRINGTWRATIHTKVREWTDSKGTPRKSNELRIINLEKIA